jgi:hypothetical protein
MEAELVGARRWNQRSQPRQKLLRLKDQARCAVAPPTAQVVEDAAIIETYESLGCQWWTRNVAAQSLQASAIVGRNGDIGV